MHILVITGVGLGSASWTDFVRLAEHRLVPVTVLDRRGYDGRAATADLALHVRDIADALEAVPGDDPVVVAGASGGATLTLALAATGHPRLGAAVVHEPLIGPAAVHQHEAIDGSLRELGCDSTPQGFERFMQRLLTTQVWADLDPSLRTAVLASERSARAEAPGFAGFALDDRQFAQAARTTTWTVGRRSAPWRHDAARVAARHGVPVRTLDIAHSPQLEAPEEWLDLVLDVTGAR